MELTIIPMPPQFRLPGDYPSVAEMERQDYDILGLHKRRTFEKGELRTVEYFAAFDPAAQVYSGLCVSEQIAYVRYDQIGLAAQGGDLVHHRTKLIRWHLDDGTAGHAKQTVKYYTIGEALAEGVVRRQNVYEEAKLAAFGLLGQENATDLLTALAPHLTLYIEGRKLPLLEALRDLQRPYMTAAARAALIEILRIEDVFN